VKEMKAGVARAKIAAFADEISDDLDEQLRVLGKLKIRRIELRSVWGCNVLDLSSEQLSRLSAGLEQGGFSVPVVGSPIGKIHVTEDFTEHLRRFSHALEVAELLGSKMIRVFSYYIPPGDTRADWRSEVVQRMRIKADQASQHGITLVHENEKGIYGESAASCLDLLLAVGSGSLMACFDPANFVQSGEKPYPDAFEKLSGWLGHIHVKDARALDGSVVPPGDGDAGWEAILRELHEIGYDGYFTLEPHLESGGRSGGKSGLELFELAHSRFVDLLRKTGWEISNS
jgi:sugar phosphate isomerase/epimerase